MKEQKGSRVLVFASSKLSWVFFLFVCRWSSQCTQFTSTPCHSGRLKQMMKIDDVTVCKSAKRDHLNRALAHY